MMETQGTEHLSMNEFAEKMIGTEPGKSFIYATGDLGFSKSRKDREGMAELVAVCKMAWSAYFDRGELCLTQRRLPDRPFDRNGASFEYIATKPGTECSEYHRKQAVRRVEQNKKGGIKW